jgi:hypothetical protein
MEDYSRFLTKMNELKAIEGKYNELSNQITPAVSTKTDSYSTDTFDKYIITLDKNPISNTKTPLVVSPGQDYADYWKYVGKITPEVGTTDVEKRKNAQKCWNMAAYDPRPFKKVVYTGNTDVNIGQPKWDNLCYGLVPDAPDTASYDTNESPGYVYMVGNGNGSTAEKTNYIYTKLGIKTTSSTSIPDISANLAKASELNDLQLRIDSLTRDIVAESDAGINNDLNDLVASAAGSNELISKINDHMNDAVSGINSDYNLVNKRKEMNSVYAEINEQTTMRARKYKFIFFIVITIVIIIGYGSYTSKLSLLDQIDNLRNYIGLGWWTNWWIIVIVVILFIISSFGWDMKGNIMMIIRYITDPAFWTGQLWWVGITFLLLFIVFFYATFKSIFMEFNTGLNKIQSAMDGNNDSE